MRLMIAILLASISSGLTAAAQQPPAAPAAGIGSPELEQLLEKVGQSQKDLKTLTGTFVQEKTLQLLAEPDVSKGILYYEAPARVVWEYLEPDRTTLLIDEKNLVAYYPDLKLADRVNIEGKRDRYDRFFGPGLVAEGQMQEYFEAELARESGIPGTKLLVLTPKSKRIEKYITEIRLWIDEKSSMPVKFEYREENGDSTTYTLSDVVTNQPIPADKLTLTLPPDVKVNEVTGGLKSRRKSGP